jgi:para-aminobenzoate synthetase component 1
MSCLVEASEVFPAPEALAEVVRSTGGLVLLRTQMFGDARHRYSLVTARPLLVYRTWGARGELLYPDGRIEPRYGDPWRVLSELLGGFEVLDAVDFPFPLGGCFGYWGYDLKQFLEPRLPRRAVHEAATPDCQVGFFGSLVVFDHELGRAWVVATGLDAEGSRDSRRAAAAAAWWHRQLDLAEQLPSIPSAEPTAGLGHELKATLTRDGFVRAVVRAQAYIRSGDVYQVNLAQRLELPCPQGGWWLHQRLARQSPAPYAAYFDHGTHELVSASPESFLRMSGSHIVTRPIKGTRPRSTDPIADARLGYELQTSAKEMAELVMITDLLRNDLGRICEFGSIGVPELAKLERFAQVQHLVSTVEGRMRSGLTHLEALAACFPGGSITGAPKIRAMEIIDELEPVTRGPYCGCHGYLGFNRESQLSVTIRTAVVAEGRAQYYAGAGIVADSDPEAEYEETMVKAKGWIDAMNFVKVVGVPSQGKTTLPMERTSIL